MQKLGYLHFGTLEGAYTRSTFAIEWRVMDIKRLSTQDPIEFDDGRTTEDLADLKLDCTDKGIVQSLHNMVTIMDGLKEWDTVFAYNEQTEQIIVTRPLPYSRGNPTLHKPRQLRDDDGSKVRMWFNRRLKWAKVSKTMCST